MSSNIRATINLVNSGKKFPAVSLVKNNPEIAATISKLVRPRDKALYDNFGNRTITAPDQNNFANISRDVAEKTKDAESITQLFPDTELSAQILISSILSPKDMSKSELTYVAGEGLKSSEISSLLVSKIKEYFTRVYKIEPLLPKILRQILFGPGSYPLVVLPENSVDDLINGTSKITMEGLSELVNKDGTFRNLGFLGNRDTKKSNGLNVVMESINVTSFSGNYNHKISDDNGIALEYITVTDNQHVLKMPKVVEKNRKIQVSNILRNNSKLGTVALEDKQKKLNDSELSQLLYKSRHVNAKPFVKIKTNSELSREPVGNPLILKLPSESIIPVFTPGDEEKHVGYFVIIDAEGNPINRNSQSDHFDDLQSRINSSTNNMSSYLLNRAKKTFGDSLTNITVTQASKVYADIIESDLLARLRNGIYGNNISIGRNEEVYRIMLSRVFQNQFTQLLYIPIELVTYFAYKYDERGIGKSLMDDMRILNSLRAMVLFSKVMASLKNSIGRTVVDLKLDERDPNPQKTIETAIHEISKTRQQYFPLGLSTPGDLVDWIQKSGYEYTFSGHPGIPDTSVQFSEKNSNYTKPDDTLEDDLRKRAIMATGLSPETVDNGFSAEFATTVVANNILLAKRVLQIQEVFIPQLTDHIRKVISNDGTLFRELREIVKENIAKVKDDSEIDIEVFKDNEELITHYVVSEFISNLTVTLPEPNSVTLENQMHAFDLYMESLDKALPFFVSTEILIQDFSGEVASKADEIKNIIKAYFCRKWLAENNVLPELSDIVITDEEGNPMLDFVKIQSEHINGLTKSIIKLMERTHKVGAAADKDIANITGGEELSESSASAPDTSSSGSMDSGGSDFGMGGDMDFGMGDSGGDFGSTEETTDNNTDENKDNEEDKENKDNSGNGELPDLASL